MNKDDCVVGPHSTVVHVTEPGVFRVGLFLGCGVGSSNLDEGVMRVEPEDTRIQKESAHLRPLTVHFVD